MWALSGQLCPGAQVWWLIPSAGNSPGPNWGKGGSPLPLPSGPLGWALTQAALILAAPDLDEGLCHSLCVSVLMGLGTLTTTTVPQTSLYILLKSSLHYDYVSPFCLVFKGSSEPGAGVKTSSQKNEFEIACLSFINSLNKILLSTYYKPTAMLNACFLPHGEYILVSLTIKK